jgi:glycosyltransferase involved in cell wall biosynthesis
MTQIPVLHLMNEVGDCSVARIIQRLVTHLGEERYSWHIGGLRGLVNMQEEFKRLDMQVVDFSERGKGLPGVAKGIRQYVQIHRVGIVHSHGLRTCLAATLALVGLRQTRHLKTNHSLYSRRDRHWGLLYAMLERLALYGPDHVIAVSQTMRRQIVALPGLDAKRVTAIQNGIDGASYYMPEERDRCRSEFGLSPESQVIGSTGRIEIVKGLDLLLYAFSQVLVQYPHACLMIVGEGEERPGLETLATNLGISHAVIWTGFRQDIPRLLAAMDIYVQPSVNEGLSLSILEAMAAGKAVIATDVGGTGEVLTHQKTGILIPAGSSSAIAAAIADLLSHAEGRAALAQAARDHVVQEFDVQRMVEGYRRVYESLASQLRSSTAGPIG